MVPDLNNINNNKLLKLIYQSFRIMTNDEFNNLKIFLENLEFIKANQGLVIVLSFHDLEHNLLE